MKSRSHHVPLADIRLEGPARPTVIPPQKRSISVIIGVITLILLLGASAVVIGSPNNVLLMARAVGVR